MTTNELGDLLASLPIDQLAAQVGEQPDDVRQAAEAALPALVGGLQANALGGGLDSLLGALDQHTADVDPTSIDTADGNKAVSHIFGAQRDDVVQQLSGTSGVSSSLIQKLLPLLAPLVLGWLAKQVAGKSGAAVPSAAGGGILGSILEQVLTGAAQGSGSAKLSGGGLGSILGDVLGGLLGGGRR